MRQIRATARTAALISPVMALALATNAMAGVFCSHINGHCCVKADGPRHEHTSTMPHMHDHQIADTDMSDHAMEMSQGEAEVTTSSSAPLDVALMKAPVPIGENSEVVTQPDEPCSHCIVHSHVSCNSSLRVAVQNSPTYQVELFDASPVSVAPTVSAVKFLALHEHGPPGTGAPLYLIVSTFRI